jgi:benzil reductase ((S)-benzoin forming)
VFVITGGGSGIGKALAHTLASRGKQILIIGRNEQALAATTENHSLIEYLVADVSQIEGRKSIHEFLKGKQITGLIHNAGIIEPISSISSISESEWETVLATNLNAPLYLTQKLLPQLSGGRVLHIGSGAAYFPVTGWAAYCTSKAALSMLTRCWQLECKEIAFASVMPGIIDTEMQAKIRRAQQMDVEKHDFFIQLKANGQLVAPETVALFLSWLLLDINEEEYESKEWDIYETFHHHAWLNSSHTVPVWE